jgi:hypothetical protein
MDQGRVYQPNPGVCCLKSQISTSRQKDGGQANPKSQTADSKPVQSDCFFVWDFKFWSLLIICSFGICYLEFQ